MRIVNFSSLTHAFALLNLYDIITFVEKIKNILIEMYILRIHINNLHKSIIKVKHSWHNAWIKYEAVVSEFQFMIQLGDCNLHQIPNGLNYLRRIEQNCFLLPWYCFWSFKVLVLIDLCCIEISSPHLNQNIMVWILLKYTS